MERDAWDWAGVGALARGGAVGSHAGGAGRMVRGWRVDDACGRGVAADA